MFKVTGSLLGILKYQSDRGRLLWTAAGGGGFANTTSHQHSLYRCGFCTGGFVQGHMARQ